MVFLEKVAGSDHVDFNEWGLIKNIEEVFGNTFPKHLANAMEETFDDDPPSACFTISFINEDGMGGPCPSDPGTIHIGLPLAAENLSYCWSFCLRDLVEGMINMHVAGESPKMQDAQEQARILAAHFRELAARLEDAASDD